MGLSLHYDVPEFKIRNFNNLDSEEIYFLNEIKIPDPSALAPNRDEALDEEGQKKLKISYFTN